MEGKNFVQKRCSSRLAYVLLWGHFLEFDFTGVLNLSLILCFSIQLRVVRLESFRILFKFSHYGLTNFSYFSVSHKSRVFIY